MTNEPLAPIFLDNKPVTLKDPKPRVSTVLSAGGRAGATEVKRLQTQAGSQGTFLAADAMLDRTSEPTKPIYLSSLPRGQEAPAKGAAAGGLDAPSPLPWTAGAKHGAGAGDAAAVDAGGKAADKAADDKSADVNLGDDVDDDEDSPAEGGGEAGKPKP